jgi:hypothetical protein
MDRSKIPTVLLADCLQTAALLRAFRWGEVSTAEEGGHFYIYVHEQGSPDQTVYTYDDPHEFQADVRRVVQFPSGDGGVGVPAPVVPTPPHLTPGFEEPIPHTDANS